MRWARCVMGPCTQDQRGAGEEWTDLAAARLRGAEGQATARQAPTQQRGELLATRVGHARLHLLQDLLQFFKSRGGGQYASLFLPRAPQSHYRAPVTVRQVEQKRDEILATASLRAWSQEKRPAVHCRAPGPDTSGPAGTQTAGEPMHWRCPVRGLKRVLRK